MGWVIETRAGRGQAQAKLADGVGMRAWQRKPSQGLLAYGDRARPSGPARPPGLAGMWFAQGKAQRALARRVVQAEAWLS